ncbi:MAG TPA: serine hydrolase, partial [Verrucomicrobiaceae bacterium]
MDGRWHLNGEVTYPGAPAEGLLMNVRMVNATFEDRNKPDFDPKANAEKFISHVPDYVAHGVRAFTLCLQGGMPGYEGAVNSAFHADGTLEQSYLDRVGRVIEACDRAGAAVILGCYYQRQSKILRDDAAVRAGVINAARWVKTSGFKNVVLEIANEYPHLGFAHRIIRDPKSEAELIRLAKSTVPGLLVSASGYGNARLDPAVAEASDFLLIHFNGVKQQDIPARIAAQKKYKKPIMCNEDDRPIDQFPAAAELSVSHGCSHGLMLNKLNQQLPFNFNGAADHPAYYEKLKELTMPRPKADVDGEAYFPSPDSAGGWRTAKNEAEIRQLAGMNRARLEDTFAYIQGSTKNGGLLVLRHGWLAFERYYGLGHHEAVPNLASCGKSFTSVAVGILMSEVPELFPDGLDQKIFTPRYFPAGAFPLSDPRKTEIKLGQLLSFTAGIRGNNPSYVDHHEVIIDPAGPDGVQAGWDEVALGKQDGTSPGGRVSAATLWCHPGEGYSYAT